MNVYINYPAPPQTPQQGQMPTPPNSTTTNDSQQAPPYEDIKHNSNYNNQGWYCNRRGGRAHGSYYHRPSYNKRYDHHYKNYGNNNNYYKNRRGGYSHGWSSNSWRTWHQQHTNTTTSTTNSEDPKIAGRPYRQVRLTTRDTSQDDDLEVPIPLNALYTKVSASATTTTNGSTYTHNISTSTTDGTNISQGVGYCNAGSESNATSNNGDRDDSPIVVDIENDDDISKKNDNCDNYKAKTNKSKDDDNNNAYNDNNDNNKPIDEQLNNNKANINNDGTMDANNTHATQGDDNNDVYDDHEKINIAGDTDESGLIANSVAAESQTKNGPYTDRGIINAELLSDLDTSGDDNGVDVENMSEANDTHFGDNDEDGDDADTQPIMTAFKRRKRIQHEKIPDQSSDNPIEDYEPSSKIPDLDEQAKHRIHAASTRLLTALEKNRQKRKRIQFSHITDKGFKVQRPYLRRKRRLDKATQTPKHWSSS